LAQFIQLNGMEQDQFGNPVIINAIGSLNVEMDMDEGPDEASMMQDTYDQIKMDPNVPFAVKLEFMPMAENKKAKIRQLMQQPPNPMQIEAMQLELQQKKANIADKQAQTVDRAAQSTERRARSMTDVARAAHLASEAHLNVQQTAREGLEMASGAAGTPANPTQQQKMPQAYQGTPQLQPNQPMQALGGARRAPDGHFYIPDGSRPGKYLRVMPNAA
jgi:hypothetical protein